jgi:ribosomal-protein-alanine N-acetyltransferase
LTIRPMVERDLDRVCAIEQAVFPVPWSRRSFRHELRDVPNSCLWVAEAGGSVVGYLISWLIEDELHIGNIAVAPGRQGGGVGTSLLGRSLVAAAESGATSATLEVRVGNARAIDLYTRFGFEPVAIRKGYYSNDGEDAMVMMKDMAHRGKKR